MSEEPRDPPPDQTWMTTEQIGVSGLAIAVAIAAVIALAGTLVVTLALVAL